MTFKTWCPSCCLTNTNKELMHKSSIPVSELLKIHAETAYTIGCCTAFLCWLSVSVADTSNACYDKSYCVILFYSWAGWLADVLFLYVVQAPAVYLTVWIAVDTVSVVCVVLFWIIQRYVRIMYYFQSSALSFEILNNFSLICDLSNCLSSIYAVYKYKPAVYLTVWIAVDTVLIKPHESIVYL